MVLETAPELPLITSARLGDRVRLLKEVEEASLDC